MHHSAVVGVVEGRAYPPDDGMLGADGRENTEGVRAEGAEKDTLGREYPPDMPLAHAAEGATAWAVRRSSAAAARVAFVRNLSDVMAVLVRVSGSPPSSGRASGKGSDKSGQR